MMNVFLLVAAAAIALVSCNKQEIEDPNSQSGEYVYKFSLSRDTKATIGEDCVVWETGDQVGVYTDGQNGVSYNRYGDITLGTPVTFKVSSNYPLELGDLVHCYYPYVNTNSQDPRTVTLSIPTSQTEKNQMPMVSLPYAVTESLTAKTESEKSAGEIKFANLGSVIEFHVYSTSDIYKTELVKSVTFNSDKAIAGDFEFDLTAVDYSSKETLEISGYEAKKVISTLSTPIVVSADKDNATVVKMVVAPGTYSGNVVVTTNKATYTYSITTEKEFKRSVVKPFGVNLSQGNRAEIDNSDLYAIVALRNSDELYYYLTNQDDGAKTKRLVASPVGTDKPEDGVVLNASKLWEVVKLGDTFKLKSFETGQYVSWTSDNSAFMDDGGLEFTVDEKDGKYTFKYTKSDDEVRYLSLNSTKGNDYFAMYNGTQTQELYLIPAVEGEEVQPTVESIEITNQTTTFTQGDSFVFGGYVKAKFSNGVEVDVTESATFSGYNMNTLGEQTVTVTYEGKTATYKITVVKKTAEVKNYVKVTSAPSDWSGTYLIVYEATPAYWDGSLSVGTSSGQMGTTTGMVKVAITDGKIMSSATVDKSVITIAKSSTGYSLKAASGSYMGMSTNNNGLKSSTKATDYVHSITLESDNTVSILSSDKYTKVAYNKSSSFFRYYKVTTINGSPGAYPLPCLYKLESDNEGVETPEQLEMSDITCSAQTENSLTFSWINVDNAIYYEVTCNGETYTTELTEYTINNLTAGQNYTISIKAVGDGVNYQTSSPVTAEGTTKETQQSDGTQKCYEKVTSAPSDWSGTYIIVGVKDSNLYAFSGMNAYGSESYGKYMSVSESETGKILSSSTIDSYQVIIAKSTNGYTIKFGDYYLGKSGTTSNTMQANKTFTAKKYEWNIALNSIQNANATSYYLQWNSNSGQERFSCYKNTQNNVILYKLQD